MANRTGKWSSDYSFLMNTIEGSLDGSKPAHAAAAPAAPAAVDSAAKRRRIAEVMPEDAEELAKAPAVRKESAAASLKLKVEVDELKLTNEQLREQLRSYKLEHEVFKEQTIRQLSFIESQNTRLKAECEARSNKYYEEKKKWQAKVRELEAKLSSAQPAGGALPAAPFPSSPLAALQPADPAAQQAQELLQDKILALERQLSEQSVRLHEATKERLELEKKLYAVEKEMSSWKSSYQDMSLHDLMQQHQELKKVYAESEQQLQRKKQDLEKLEKRIKNQSILQEEYSSLQFRYSLLEESQKQFKHMEQEFTALKEEAKNWTTIFQKVIQEHATHDTGAAGQPVVLSVVRPMQVLQIVQSYQQRYALQLVKQKDLETEAHELQQALASSKHQVDELIAKSTSTSQAMKALEARNLLLVQRQRLYEGELTSLRNMVSTYDMEFQIGKPSADRMLALKDEETTRLRSEVDRIRQQAQEWSDKLLAADEQIAELTRALEAAPKHVPVSEAADTDAPALQELQTDFLALQEITGMDYLPHKTRVLRLVDNPLDLTRGRQTQSSLPHELLAHLRTENNRLKSELAEAASHVQGIGSSSSSEEQHDHHNQSVVDPNSSVLHTTFSAISGPDQAKLNQRLKEMFKEKIATFREAVYLLTGFRVDMLPVNDNESLPRIRLRSMYAEQAEDCMMFQLRNGVPELLETEFAARLTPQHLQHLQTYNSVPAFLANLTLELFDSQTYMG